MANEQEEDYSMELLTLNQISKEFRVARSTLNWWVRQKLLPAQRELSELGVEYWRVRRGDVEHMLANRPQRGRPLKRSG